jgi:hypothetical protein
MARPSCHMAITIRLEKYAQNSKDAFLSENTLRMPVFSPVVQVSHRQRMRCNHLYAKDMRKNLNP